MGFKKGHKQFGGIKKGEKQKRTLEWEEFGRNLLKLGLPRAFKIMEKNTDDKFMFYFEKYLEYFKPKLARTELTGSIQVNTISDKTSFQIKTRK